MKRAGLVVLVAACGSSGGEHPRGPVEQPTVTPAVATADPLVAQAKPVTDTYHGVAVSDSYRWLESDDAAVHAWSAAQNQHARAYLDRLPDLATLRKELRDIIGAPIVRYGELTSSGGKMFALRKQPTHEQAELVVMADPAAPADAHLIFDPAASGGAQQTIDWARPSPDGKKVAMSVSVGGSEAGELHVVDLDGKDVEPVIPNIQRGTGGGDVAWTPDGKGLYYTRYPSPGEKPANELDGWLTVWFHQLGAPIASDHQELFKDLPRIAEIQLASDSRGRLIASVQNGDGGTFRHYLRDKSGWRLLDDWNDHIVAVEFGETDELWLVSRANALRGKLLRLAANAKTATDAKLVVPEGKDAIVTEFTEHHNIVAAGGRVFLSYQVGGPSELRAFTRDGKPAAAPAAPPISSVGDTTAWKTGVIYGATSYTTPRTFHYFDPAHGTSTDLPALSPKPPVDLSGFEVSREMATSKDGTSIPLNIVWPKGAPRDGSTPCLVTGYGGFGYNIEPAFLARWSPLLHRGFCFVEVNLRGGGEFGEAWHQAGALTNKQNVFDDFAAAVQFVITNKYSSAAKIAIEGGSNGGLLMGALITQHPELVHAVVSEVGIYDMLRVELSPNGIYNTTEYGTVADADQFKALYAYSPYHHVASSSYPAILMTTGANDPRVSPWQSRKMVAALQAAQTGGAPILLRTSDKAGHGMGSSMSEQIDLLADVQTFILAQLKP